MCEEIRWPSCYGVQKPPRKEIKKPRCEETKKPPFGATIRKLTRRLCKTADDEWGKRDQRWMTGVLVGNWFEEYFQITPGSDRAKVTKVTEYTSKYTPHLECDDFMVKYENKLKLLEGRPKEFVLGHYDRDSHLKYLITTYDEHFNHRERPYDQQFPELRIRNHSRNAWLPEKSDYPLIGEPTNWGLKDVRRQELLKQIGLLRDSSKLMMSTYQASYNRKLCTGCPSK